MRYVRLGFELAGTQADAVRGRERVLLHGRRGSVGNGDAGLGS